MTFSITELKLFSAFGSLLYNSEVKIDFSACTLEELELYLQYHLQAERRDLHVFENMVASIELDTSAAPDAHDLIMGSLFIHDLQRRIS